MEVEAEWRLRRDGGLDGTKVETECKVVLGRYGKKLDGRYRLWLNT